MVRVYADNAATTQLSRKAIDAMKPYFEEVYGNPSSLYSIGQEAARAVLVARETMARQLNCEARDYLYFRRSESNNQAIISAALIGEKKGKSTLFQARLSTTRC